MSNPPIKNVWHLRAVAETSSKPCMICFKPVTAVLITPDQKDYFYICRGHLTDKGFATPLVDPAEAEKKRKEAETKAETDRIVAEYREKQAQKEKDKKEKEKKNKDKDKDDDKKNESKEDGDKKDEDKKQEDKKSEPSADEIPRIYQLHRNFYQMRLDRLQKAEIARRNREILRNPTSFPAVPKDLP